MRSSAQSINEYVIVIALVTAIFVSMQMYIKRGIQASIKDTADQLGAQAEPYLFGGTVSSQALGALEQGLTAYTVIKEPYSLYQKHVNVNTSPNGATTKVTTGDVVVSEAKWTSTYNVENVVGFSSNDRLDGGKNKQGK